MREDGMHRGFHRWAQTVVVRDVLFIAVDAGADGGEGDGEEDIVAVGMNQPCP